ncbi:hypothetical protein EB001_09710 [bacterium]|nr:hypothetical protein [bacterium]
MKLFDFKWYLPALGDYFTFYKGGGGGGGTSTTQQQLDPTVRPFVEYGLGEAKNLYQTSTPEYYAGQTYVSPSAQTTTALSEAEARAKAGSPLLPAAQGQQYDVISGRYLAPNPYLAAAMRPAIETATTSYNDAIKQAQSDLSKAGRYGSNVGADIQNRAATTLANTLANKGAELAYGNYATERAAQNAAALAAPNLAAADYQDIQQLMNVGKTQEDYAKTALQADIDRFNFEQNKPYQKLSAYLGAAYGAPMGQVSTTTQSKQGKIVCTAMNQAYGFGSFRQAIWLQHSANMPNAKTIEKGYHKLFLPVVAFAFSTKQSFARKIVRNIAEHIARHRTADLWKEMRGKRRDPLGRLYRAIIEPICYLAGKVGK